MPNIKALSRDEQGPLKGFVGIISFQHVQNNNICFLQTEFYQRYCLFVDHTFGFAMNNCTWYLMNRTGIEDLVQIVLTLFFKCLQHIGSNHIL